MPHQLSKTVSDQANEHLDTIEDEYNVTIVFAVAHGSHAWGLNNDDSDYDIKSIYAPDNLHQYAQLGEHDETINREFGEYEIEAWDVQKFAELLSQSNEQALDILRSPIAYRERMPRSEIREFIEQQYNPIALYHTYRSIAKNNYRKYLSNHLTSNRQTVYPIIEEHTDGYTVRNLHTDEELFVPDRVIDNDNEEFIELPFEAVDTSEDDHRYCPNCDRQPDTLPLKFQTTQTRRTVKRNLAVIRAAMHAYYVKRTGEADGHELPHVDFPTFLTEQAPGVFEDDIIDLAWELVELKRDGVNKDIGDQLGREFSHPPQVIDHKLHATSSPDQDDLNAFISDILSHAE